MPKSPYSLKVNDKTLCRSLVLRRKSAHRHRGIIEPKQPDTHDYAGQRLVNIDGHASNADGSGSAGPRKPLLRTDPIENSG